MDMSTKWYEKALNNTCPECKKAIKHAVVCHRHKQLICMDCCSDCQYLTKSQGDWHCNFDKEKCPCLETRA